MVRAATWLHFGSGGCAGAARLHDGHVDAAPGEIDRERQADGAGADDQDIAIRHVADASRLCHSASAPEFFTIAAQRSTSVLM